MDSFTINVEHIGKRFDDLRVFSDISFNHQRGSLGIAGSNGSGKSTLLQCLAGLMRPTSGTISWHIDGQTVEKGILRTHLGFAAPYVNLYNELTCWENLEFLLKLRGVINRNPLIANALKQTGLYEFGQHSFNQLSTGQQQRLRISAALIHNPDILFLDEPGSNLDETGQKIIKNIATQFNQPGKAIVIASNLSAELNYCDTLFSVEEQQFI